jgi:hypothetical protein
MTFGWIYMTVNKTDTGIRDKIDNVAENLNKYQHRD